MSTTRLRAALLGLLGWVAAATTARADYDIGDLGTLPNGVQTQGLGINGTGLVAGSATLMTGQEHAILALPGGTIRDLGTLGGRNSKSFAVNDTGMVAGQSDLARG